MSGYSVTLVQVYHIRNTYVYTRTDKPIGSLHRADTKMQECRLQVAFNLPFNLHMQKCILKFEAKMMTNVWLFENVCACLYI